MAAEGGERLPPPMRSFHDIVIAAQTQQDPEGGRSRSYDPHAAAPPPTSSLGPDGKPIRLQRSFSDRLTQIVRPSARDRWRNAVDAAMQEFFCPICFENVPIGNSFRVGACSDAEHLLCHQCARTYVLSYVRNGGSAANMTCPYTDDCKAPFTRDDVVRLDGEDGEVTAQYDRFANKETGEFTDCPKCQTQQRGDPSNPIMTCSNASCEARFCFFHGLAHEPDEACDVYLRRIAQQDEESRKELARSTVECPRCSRWVSKSRGCNHMTCVCSENFCYLCGESINGTVGLHYGDHGYCSGLQFADLGPNSRRPTGWRMCYRVTCSWITKILAVPYLIISPALFFVVLGISLAMGAIACACCCCIAGLFAIADDSDSVLEPLLMCVLGPTYVFLLVTSRFCAAIGCFWLTDIVT